MTSSQRQKHKKITQSEDTNFKSQLYFNTEKRGELNSNDTAVFSSEEMKSPVFSVLATAPINNLLLWDPENCSMS